MPSTGRICVLVNSLSGGGGETVALMLCRAFKQQGMDVLLLCVERNDRLDAAGIDVHYLSDRSGAEGGLLKILSLPVLAMKLKRFIGDNNIDHVQSHMYRANYTNVLARLLGAKQAVQIVNHGIAGRYKSLGLMGKVNLSLIRFLYPRADQLLCPSTGMMDDLVLCGVTGAKMNLVPNPFNLDGIVAAAKAPLPDDYLASIAGRKVIIAVGRLESVKRPSDIIEAFKKVYENNNNTCLILLGEGSERAQLERLVSESGLESSVILTGYVANPFSYIGQADILVTASDYEGFSNVIVEALTLGVPVVSSDCTGGPREILSGSDDYEHDGEATVPAGEVHVMEYGLLVPVGDTDAMQIAMKRLLSDDGLRRRYISKGYLRAENFAVEKITQQHLRLLMET